MLEYITPEEAGVSSAAIQELCGLAIGFALQNGLIDPEAPKHRAPYLLTIPLPPSSFPL